MVSHQVIDIATANTQPTLMLTALVLLLGAQDRAH